MVIQYAHGPLSSRESFPNPPIAVGCANRFLIAMIGVQSLCIGSVPLEHLMGRLLGTGAEGGPRL